MNAQRFIKYKSFAIFLVERFLINAIKTCGNGPITENFFTGKLGEISVFNAVQEFDLINLCIYNLQLY